MNRATTDFPPDCSQFERWVNDFTNINRLGQPPSPRSHGSAAQSADDIRSTNSESYDAVSTTQHSESYQELARQEIPTIQNDIEPADHVAVATDQGQNAVIAQALFDPSLSPTASRIIPLLPEIMSTTDHARMAIENPRAEESYSEDMVCHYLATK